MRSEDVHTVGLPAGAPSISVGDHVRVTQRIVARRGTWTTNVEGVVEAYRPEPTGSWFKHGKGDRLWLVRLRIRKADGELTTLALDGSSSIEIRPR